MAVSYPFSSKISHFVPPKQWASMRVARDLEKETGQKIIHFEKGDYQGPDFDTPQHVLDATEQALREGYVRYDPGPGLPELREALAQEMTGRGRPTQPRTVETWRSVSGVASRTALAHGSGTSIAGAGQCVQSPSREARWTMRGCLSVPDVGVRCGCVRAVIGGSATAPGAARRRHGARGFAPPVRATNAAVAGGTAMPSASAAIEPGGPVPSKK